MKKIKLFLLGGVSLFSYLAVSNSALGESSEANVSGKLSTEITDGNRNTLTTTETLTITTTTTSETTTIRVTTTRTTSRTTGGTTPIENPDDGKKSE